MGNFNPDLYLDTRQNTTEVHINALWKKKKTCFVFFFPSEDA